MLKTIICILTFVVLLGTGCQPSHNPVVTESNLVDSIIDKKIESTHLDGYWILTNYLDSIFKDRSIAKHRLDRISFRTMLLHIQKDSLFSTGIFHFDKNKISIKINPNRDTLCIIEDQGTFVFRYNKKRDWIEATDISSDKYNNFKGKKYIYRRVTEQRLMDILDKDNIRVGFYQLFIDTLIAGEYQSLDNGQKMTLEANGLMRGFKKYNKYHIHDYFGLYHPFQNYDAIFFEDTTMISPENAHTTQNKYYNWTFSGDTLRLTEMMTENHFEYFLGKQTYNFIKTKKLHQ